MFKWNRYLSWRSPFVRAGFCTVLIRYIFCLIVSQLPTIHAQNEIDNTGENSDSGYSWEGGKSDDDEEYLQNSMSKLDSREHQFAEKLRVSSSTNVRRFHEVLDELLAEFSYEIKMGQINGLKNLSIRNVDVSEAIPKTYRRYLELLTSERIREYSKIRLISCLPCRSKTSKLVEGKLMITSPATNVEELDRAASQLGIDHFMDVVLVYHSTHMVLAFQIFDSKSKETVWSRTYNSETIRSRYQKLAVDFSQIDKGRNAQEYIPEYRLMLAVGGGSLPNVGGTAADKSMLAVHIRGTEKFDNRRQEFGLQFNYYQATSTLMMPIPTTGNAPTEEEQPPAEEDDTLRPTPYTMAAALYAVYSYNFIGPLESYNKVRYGLNAGIGLHMAFGYVAPSARIGLDTFFGRRFIVSPSLVYLSSTRVLLGDEFITIPGNAGAEIVLGVNF